MDIDSVKLKPLYKQMLRISDSTRTRGILPCSNGQTPPVDLSRPSREVTIFNNGVPKKVIIGGNAAKLAKLDLRSSEPTESDLFELVRFYRNSNHSAPNEATSQIAEIFDPRLFTYDATHGDMKDKEIDLDKLAYNLLLYSMEHNLLIEDVFKQFALNRIERNDECLADFSKLDPVEIFELAYRLTRASEDENPTNAIELIIKTFDIPNDKLGRERLSDFIFDSLFRLGKVKKIKNPILQFIDAAFENVYSSNKA